MSEPDGAEAGEEGHGDQHAHSQQAEAEGIDARARLADAIGGAPDGAR